MTAAPARGRGGCAGRVALAALAAAAAGLLPTAAAASDPVPLTERETIGDVFGWDSLGGAFRPELDLLAAGAVADGNGLRLRIVTAGPPLRAVLGFGASAAGCDDDQLAVLIEIDGDGTATVRATDYVSRSLRPPIHAYTLTREGNDLTLDLPLLAPPPLADWNVSSATLGPASDWASYGDTLPDWFIEGAYFTRGTGRRNGPPTCGPADPPLLLPRGRG